MRTHSAQLGVAVIALVLSVLVAWPGFWVPDAFGATGQDQVATVTDESTDDSTGVPSDGSSAPLLTPEESADTSKESADSPTPDVTEEAAPAADAESTGESADGGGVLATDELEVSEEPVPFALRDVGGAVQEIPVNMMNWTYTPRSSWMFPITLVAPLPSNVKYVREVTVKLPLVNRSGSPANGNGMPNITAATATAVGPDSSPIYVGVTASSREDATHQILTFTFDSPVPSEFFSETKSFDIDFQAEISWPGAWLDANRRLAATQIMKGASVSITGLDESAPDITPWDPNQAYGPTATIRVKVSEMRDSGGLNPLPGAVLQLHLADNPKVTRDPYWGNSRPAHDSHWGTPGTAIEADWARCTVDASGYCTFTVPAPEKKGGIDGAYYWVSEYSAPEGYKPIDELRVGFSGGNSGGARGNSHVLDYAYRTSALYAGDILTSGDGRADGGFMTYNPSGDYVTFNDEGIKLPRSSSGQFVYRRDNPALPDRCGIINVAIVLDTSLSMADWKFDTKETADGALKAIYDFVGELRGTGVNLGFTTFSDDAGTYNKAHQIIAPIPMDDAGVKRVQDIVGTSRRTSKLTFSGSTNWDAGLRTVAEYNEKNPQNGYDVVIVITDGNPTRSEAPGQSGPGNAGDFALMENTVASANWLKSTAGGTRMVGIGVGTFNRGGIVGKDPDISLSERTFNAVFGPNGTQDSVPSVAEVAQRDWIVFDGGNEERLADVLSGIAMASCEASVVVEKETQVDGGGITPGGAGWHFNASGLAEGFSFSDAPAAANQAKTTGDDSIVEYRLQLDKATRTNGTITISEDLSKNPDSDAGWDISQRGDPLRNAICVDNSKPGAPSVPVEDEGKYGFKLTGLSNSSRVHCKVLNVRETEKPTYLEILKVDAGEVETVLTGAEFSVYPSDVGGKLDKSVPIEFANGKFTMEPGIYGILETQAPEGYALLPAPVYFEVLTEGNKPTLSLLDFDDKGQLVRSGSTSAALVDLIDPVTGQPTESSMVTTDEHGVFHLRIADVTTGTLPVTGDTGVAPLAFMAGALAMAAILVARRGEIVVS